jgi:hypothetical protein
VISWKIITMIFFSLEKGLHRLVTVRLGNGSSGHCVCVYTRWETVTRTVIPATATNNRLVPLLLRDHVTDCQWSSSLWKTLPGDSKMWHFPPPIVFVFRLNANCSQCQKHVTFAFKFLSEKTKRWKLW